MCQDSRCFTTRVNHVFWSILMYAGKLVSLITPMQRIYAWQPPRITFTRWAAKSMIYQLDPGSFDPQGKRFFKSCPSKCALKGAYGPYQWHWNTFSPLADQCGAAGSISWLSEKWLPAVVSFRVQVVGPGLVSGFVMKFGTFPEIISHSADTTNYTKLQFISIYARLGFRHLSVTIVSISFVQNYSFMANIITLIQSVLSAHHHFPRPAVILPGCRPGAWGHPMMIIWKVALLWYHSFTMIS